MHVIAVLVSLAGIAIAKECVNLTVPLSVSARTAVFDIPPLKTDLEATTFIQNLTQNGANFSNRALTGYATTSKTYNISAQFCAPSDYSSNSPTLQILTHGVGFDKTYWDNAYNNFNYSYVNVATDQYKYYTFSFDRLGIGNSSHGDALNEIQTPLELAALVELTNMLRKGSVAGIDTKFSKIVHVGHSFGSILTYSLVSVFPDLSDGIVLTGFGLNVSFQGLFIAGANFVPASQNQPYRLGNAKTPSYQGKWKLSPTVRPQVIGLVDYFTAEDDPVRINYSDGYLVNSDVGALQYLFFTPGYFDQGLLFAAEATKQPAAIGELLTLAGGPPTNQYAGPVIIVTGNGDLPFCGGDCLATGDPSLPSIPAAAQKTFPNLAPEDFEAYIQPNTGHGLNFHYNATGAYNVINNFLNSKGLASK